MWLITLLTFRNCKLSGTICFTKCKKKKCESLHYRGETKKKESICSFNFELPRFHIRFWWFFLTNVFRGLCSFKSLYKIFSLCGKNTRSLICTIYCHIGNHNNNVNKSKNKIKCSLYNVNRYVHCNTSLHW